MEELIKVATNAEGKQVVSARELHHFLEAKTDVGLWTRRMLDYGFEENVDYITLKSENPINKQVTTLDYVLTLSCAKEISMIQRTDKGKQARLYFLECEKKLMQPKELSRLEILTLAIEAEKKVIELQEKIDSDKPKVEFAEQLLSATNSLDFGTSSKAMNLPFGRNKMFEICRNLGFLMHTNQPYQQFVENGYFTLLETSFVHPKSGDRVLTTKTMITSKGQTWLIRNFKKHGYM